MFQEVKDTLPISGDDYDAQIIMEIKACALDLTTSAEITLPGTIAITRQQVQGVWTITDTSTLTDELIMTAISVWCNMRIGNPPNYDNLLKAYESLKGQLRLSKSYTLYGEAEVTAE
jgi:hypothetical protein